MRVKVRERLAPEHHLKPNHNKGKNNQSLFLKQVNSVNAILGRSKISYFNSIDRVYENSVKVHRKI